MPVKTTLDTKIRWFQYSLINSIVPVNRYLKIINIVDCNECDIHQIDEETILHLFLYCPHVRKLWSDLEIYLIKKQT